MRIAVARLVMRSRSRKSSTAAISLTLRTVAIRALFPLMEEQVLHRAPNAIR